MDDRFGLQAALARDAADPLAQFRARFSVPPETVYLDGNSLGLASRDAEQSLLAALEDWRTQGIDGWLGARSAWFGLGEALGARQAALVGAEPDEVVVTGGTTVNLHALVATFFRPEGARRVILADDLNFPSDLYALASLARLVGGEVRLVRSRDGRTLDEDDVIAAMSDDVALALLPSVLYRGGQLLDLAHLASAARERGIPIGFDCSHSVGCVPHELHAWGVDFAFWCNYKYVNGGPGAPASLFVHRRLFGTAPALAGWWGSDKARQFDMALEMTPAAGAAAWQIGTPPVLSLAALDGGMRALEDAGIAAVRAKSLALTGYLIELADELLARRGFHVGTPREPSRRGGHVALEHPEAVRLTRALKARRIVPDYRPPNVVRLAPVAPYNTFEEVCRTVVALAEIVDRGEHLAFPAERGVVA